MFRALTTEKSYKRLFYAGLINGIGDRFSQVALLALILQMTGSGLSVGITMALRMIPFLLFGPLSCKAAEVFSRKKLLVYTDFLRAIIATSFLFINGQEDMWIVYLSSFLLASGEALYGPTRKACIPAIIQQKNLKEVNSWEQVLLGFVLIIGALTGGVVSYLFGAKAAFIINILSFIFAGMIIASISNLEVSKNKVTETSTETLKPMSFLSVVTSSSLLLMLFSLDLLIPLTNGIENILLSVYAVETFQAGDMGVGILYSVLGTGFIISPIVVKWINGRLLLFAFMAIMMEGVILVVISQTQSFYFVVLFFGVLTIFAGVGNTLLDTVVMESVPLKWQGVYFGLSATLANTMLGFSMFTTGILLEYFTPREMGLINGLLYITFGLTFLLWSIRLNVQNEHKKIAITKLAKR